MISRRGAHGVFRPQPSGLIQFAGLARDGGHTSFAELAPWLCPNRSARLPCKTADLAISQAVVDEAEELSRPRRRGRS